MSSYPYSQMGSVPVNHQKVTDPLEILCRSFTEKVKTYIDKAQKKEEFLIKRKTTNTDFIESRNY